MKKYDFAFIYEVKNRELDSVCLLASELENRGYSCCIINSWERVLKVKKKVKADIVFTFALYSDGMIDLVAQYVYGFKNIINLQWEQIYTNATEDSSVSELSTAKGVHGKAKNAVHISWGARNFKFLTEKYGVPRENVFVAGKISLDFYRKSFDSVWMNRQELCRKFGIPEGRQIVLIISSFTYSGLPQNILNSDLYQKQGFNVNEFADICRYSQAEAVDWICNAADRYPEYTFIYRPHPAEHSSANVNAMEKKHDNIKVISDYQIGNWIKAADKAYMWWSTSVCEVYAAHKKCGIIRPMEIPHGSDLCIYNNGTFLKDIESFLNDICSDADFPIDSETVNDFIDIDNVVPSYVRVCDIAERVLSDEQYRYDYAVGGESVSAVRRVLKNMKVGLAYRMVDCNVGRMILKCRHSEEVYKELVEDQSYNLKMYRNNYVSPRNIRHKIKVFHKIISMEASGQ